MDTFSNMAKLKFKSLSSSRGSNLGFLASINASVEACGGTLEGSTGTIQTPGYPHGYAHRKFCAWSIIGPADRRIKLTFDDFDLEPPVVQLSTNRSRCRYDYVYITSGNLRQFSTPIFTGSPTKCGSAIPDPVSSASNVMRVGFRSDGSVSHRGFSASWTSDELGLYYF